MMGVPAASCCVFWLTKCPGLDSCRLSPAFCSFYGKKPLAFKSLQLAALSGCCCCLRRLQGSPGMLGTVQMLHS